MTAKDFFPTRLPLLEEPRLDSSHQSSHAAKTISSTSNSEFINKAHNIMLGEVVSLPALHKAGSRRRTPSLHTLDDSPEARQTYFTKCVPLHKATLRDDWKAAERIISKDPEIIRASITKGWQTVLHVAAGAGHFQFVKKLLKLLTKADLYFQDAKGNTAFCFAVAAGSVPVAEIMIEKNPDLPEIRGGEGMTTLYMAVLFGQGEMALYLYPKLINMVDQGERIGIFFTCITNGLYELALKMAHDYGELAVARDTNDETALHLLSRRPSAFAIQSPGRLKSYLHSCKFLSSSHPSLQLTKSKSCLVLCDEGTHKGKYSTGPPALQLLKYLWKGILWQSNWMVTDVIRRPSHVLFTATELGNFEFVAELLGSYPDLIWETDGCNRTLFHIAVLHHQTSIFNLLHELGLYKDFIVSFKDDKNNNIMHLAAKLAPLHLLNTVSGPALQMQREIIWFDEVKKVVPPCFIEMKNSEGKTASDIFTEEHKDLVEKAELWVKDVARSGTLVSTLIAITVFASGLSLFFSVLGDRNIPNGVKETTVCVFVILHSLALFSSSVGMLNFLSIQTSRFAQRDFLKSLPLKLIIGFIALFISTAAMMLSFNTALYMAYHRRLKWLPTFIFILASFLVCCFYLLHYPLVSHALYSTYYSRHVFLPNK